MFQERISLCGDWGLASVKTVTVMSPQVQVPDSQRLRDRAVECRALAELFRAQAARNHLLEIAADYDHLSMKAAALELADADRQGTSIP